MAAQSPSHYWQFSDDPLALPVEGNYGRGEVPLDVPISGKGKPPKKPHWTVHIEPDGQEWLATNAKRNTKDFAATVEGFTFWTAIANQSATVEEAQIHALKSRRSAVAITLESEQHGGKTRPTDGFGWVIAQLEKRQLSAEDLAGERSAWGVWTWIDGFYRPMWRWAVDFRGRAGIPSFSEKGTEFLGLICFQCDELMTSDRDHACQPTGTLLVRF